MYPIPLHTDMFKYLYMAFKKFAYKYSVRKHIEEGICLPSVDGFLSRNVTTQPRLWFCEDVGAMYITCMGTVTTNDL